MKQLFLLVLLFSSVPLLAQNLHGEVKDGFSRQAIVNVQVIAKNSTVVTDTSGHFALTNVAVGDHISFRLMGYETKEIVVSAVHFKTMVIYLTANTVQLKEINITGTRNYKMDSLALRREFAGIFNQKDTRINDMFVMINPEYKPPLALVRPASASSLVTLNVLQVFSFLGKKKARTTRLKEILIADEKANFVADRFSKNKVATLTKLHGDSLQRFIYRYKPPFEEIKKMNDYEISTYIKKCYADFIKP